MADGLIQVPVDSTGKKVDTSELTVGANTVERQRIVVADPTTAANLATVSAGGALKVDNSAVTQPVSGTVSLTAGQAVELLDSGGTNKASISAAGAVKVDGSAVTQPVSGTFWQATQPVSGTVTANQGGTWTVQPGNTANTTPWLVDIAPATSGGLSISRTLSGASTNATSVKASAGMVYAWSIYNTTASTIRYVKFYDKASAPTVGTDVPVLTLLIPASGGTNFSNDLGLVFVNGIAFAITGGVTDADTTAVAANDIVLNFFYK